MSSLARKLLYLLSMRVDVIDNKLEGIYIFPQDLAEIEKHIAELYELKEKFKDQSVFDLSANQLKEKLRPTVNKLRKEAWDKGSYISYVQTDPSIEATFVHQYKDGKKEYVDIDTETGKTVLVKTNR
ncbi:MAG: hypothetical protein JST19_18255 [Bacteroidetes bacterium]|nr:hypothetical protein [Bacteroidota bacterium]